MNLMKNTNVSTRTIISDVNVKLDIDRIFKTIPLQVQLRDYPCRIVTMYYKNTIKGDVSVLENRNCNQSFRNSVNIIFRIHEQLVNVKVSTHGNFQITGAKIRANCYQVICYFLDLCMEYTPDVIQKTKEDENLEIIFDTVMTNIVFNTHFKIDKIKLNKVLQKNSDFYNLFETSFGYTGMNVKLPLETETWKNFLIPKYIRNNEKKIWKETMIEYDSYFSNHTTKKKKKKKYNTFLIFHSGKIIMSGMIEENMKDHFSFFYQFLQDHRHEIEEVIQSC